MLTDSLVNKYLPDATGELLLRKGERRANKLRG